jgi:hypothetical protein
MVYVIADPDVVQVVRLAIDRRLEQSDAGKRARRA